MKFILNVYMQAKTNSIYTRETINEAQKNCTETKEAEGGENSQTNTYTHTKTYYICHNFRNAFVYKYKYKYKFMWTCVLCMLSQWDSVCLVS